uniref:Nuclear protein Tc22 n=1 Tax=Trypanosoma cruzi TaxID=5693 RepID=Q5J6K5_TRYCR|nr:nuclear protein Tc22 [Trypanosoma cruzi]
MVQGGVVEIPPNFVPLEHVCRALKNADCRTPVIFFYEDGDPFLSLCKIAREMQSAVWHFDLAVIKSIQNVMDYIDVGTKNGDWVLISHCEEVEQHRFREVALRVFLLKPEPKKYPRREFFRCLFCVEKVFELEGNAMTPFLRSFSRTPLFQDAWMRVLQSGALNFHRMLNTEKLRN